MIQEKERVPVAREKAPAAQEKEPVAQEKAPAVLGLGLEPAKMDEMPYPWCTGV